jgi:hypothetical protein
MLLKEPVENPEPDDDKAVNEALLHGSESNKSAFPHTQHPQKAVRFCTPPVPVLHLKWWLTKLFADHLDIVYSYAELGNNERTEMQLELEDSRNFSMFVITPKVGGTSLNLKAANHTVITQKFWVIDKQHQELARVVRLGQNRVPQTVVLNMGPSGYDNRAGDLHQLSGVAQMKVLHGLISQPDITTLMVYRILACREQHPNQHLEEGDVVQSDYEDER